MIKFGLDFNHGLKADLDNSLVENTKKNPEHSLHWI